MELLLAQVMISCLNVPYIWGGSNPLTGLDCSGFAIWCLRSIGLWNSGDTTAQGLHNHFSKAKGSTYSIDYKFPKVGTLAFFGKSITEITHVGLIIEGRIMVEAGGGGSKTLTPDDAKKAGACVRVMPLSRRPDLVALVSPWSQPTP